MIKRPYDNAGDDAAERLDVPVPPVPRFASANKASDLPVVPTAFQKSPAGSYGTAQKTVTGAAQKTVTGAAQKTVTGAAQKTVTGAAQKTATGAAGNRSVLIVRQKSNFSSVMVVLFFAIIAGGIGYFVWDNFDKIKPLLNSQKTIVIGNNSQTTGTAGTGATAHDADGDGEIPTITETEENPATTTDTAGDGSGANENSPTGESPTGTVGNDLPGAGKHDHAEGDGTGCSSAVLIPPSAPNSSAGTGTPPVVTEPTAVAKFLAAYKPPADARIIPASGIRKNTTSSTLEKEVFKKFTGTPSNPQRVEKGESLERRKLSELAAKYMKSWSERSAKNPLADAFPGKVPDDAPRLRVVRRYPRRESGWISTGFYAPAGERISVRVSNFASVRGGISVKIGCHSDTLFLHENWKRFPAIQIGKGLQKATTHLCSPFGGLVFLEIAGDANDKREVTVELSGVVEAPSYHAGKTTDTEWARVRRAPAPWAELVCRNIAVSVPSEYLRRLDNPKQLTKLWESIIDAADELLAHKPAQTVANRLVFDVQISIPPPAFMHSGYPVMAHLVSCNEATNYEILARKGSWGFFHEYGHNRQNGEWTFAGYGEVTCNLFALYIYEKVMGRKVATGWGTQFDDAVRSKVENPRASKVDRLCEYVPVLSEFGWKPLQSTFEEYEKSKKQDYDLKVMRRRNERTEQKIKRRRNRDRSDIITATLERDGSDGMLKDTFVRIWSKHCKANLSFYFEKIGFPITDETKRLLAKYKPWLPDVAGGRRELAKLLESEAALKAAKLSPKDAFLELEAARQKILLELITGQNGKDGKALMDLMKSAEKRDEAFTKKITAALEQAGITDDKKLKDEEETPLDGSFFAEPPEDNSPNTSYKNRLWRIKINRDQDIERFAASTANRLRVKYEAMLARAVKEKDTALAAQIRVAMKYLNLSRSPWTHGKWRGPDGLVLVFSTGQAKVTQGEVWIKKRDKTTERKPWREVVEDGLLGVVVKIPLPAKKKTAGSTEMTLYLLDDGKTLRTKDRSFKLSRE